jgi:hypothetical protein
MTSTFNAQKKDNHSVLEQNAANKTPLLLDREVWNDNTFI